METMMMAGMIANPIGLMICILMPAVAIIGARRPRLPATRLAAGYVGALCALAVAVAASSYVSPQESVSVWHVLPEHYWSALLAEFLSTFVVVAFASIIGISVVGLPVLVMLSKGGRATAPWLMAYPDFCGNLGFFGDRLVRAGAFNFELDVLPDALVPGRFPRFDGHWICFGRKVALGTSI